MAVHSKGTKLFIGNDDDPIAWTAIPGVTGVPVPAVSVGEINTSDLDSEWEEYIEDLKDGGEINFTLNLKRKTTGAGFHEAQEALEDAAGAGAKNFKITLPAPFSKSYTFKALVKTFQPDAQLKAALSASVTLRLTGPVARSTAV